MKEQAQQQQDAMLSALAEESIDVSRGSLASPAFADPMLQRCARAHPLCAERVLRAQTHEH